MNRHQKIAVWANAALVVITVVFPPWSYSSGREYMGLCFIGNHYRGTHVDFTVLFAEWVAIGALSVAAFLTLRESKS